MHAIRLMTFSSLLVASVAAQAGDFSYDYLEGGFGEVGTTGGGNNSDIIYLGGAKTLDAKFGLLGAVGFADYGANTDGNVLRGGGLFRTSLQKDLDFFGTLELVYSNWDAPGNSDDLGVIAAGGLRYAVQDNFELEGKLTMVEVDPFDDGLGVTAGARYFMDKQLSAAAGIAANADYDGLFINVRYDLK